MLFRFILNNKNHLVVGTSVMCKWKNLRLKFVWHTGITTQVTGLA